MDYKKLFNDTYILDTRTNIPGEFVWYPFGWKIRNLYVEYIKNQLESHTYEEWHLADFLGKKGIELMHNNIMPVKDKLYPVSNVANNGTQTFEYYLAPTHEVSLSEAMSRYIENDYDLPINLFHIGCAFRKKYNSSFPFGLSKRNTYIECYNIQKSKENLYEQLDSVLLINKNILGDFLALPFVESVRPSLTNNPVSKKTIGIDVLTPMNRTLHAGMIYIQEDIFTKIYGVQYYDRDIKMKLNPQVIHYGFTDNLLMASIIHGFNLGNGKKIILPDQLMPYHIGITTSNNGFTKFSDLLRELKKNGIRYEIIKSFPFGHKQNKAIIHKINVQNPYIHIKEVNDLGFITYRIIGENNRLKNDIEGIIKCIMKLREERMTYMKVKKEQIIKDRVIKIEDNSQINKLIAQGHVLDVYLENDNETILSMEKFIKGGEILGYREVTIFGKCIFTGKKNK